MYCRLLPQKVRSFNDRFQALSETIQVVDLGPSQIKGKTQEVTIYSVPVGQTG